MENLNNLIEVLYNCNDTSIDSLIIKSKKLEISKDILIRFNISFDEEKEGIRIDLSRQNIKIYKNKIDCIREFNGNIGQSIIILYDKISFMKLENNTNIFFENLIYSYKIRKLLIKKKFVSYHEEFEKKFILLSESKPKIEISYKGKDLEFYDGKYNLKNIFNRLDTKLEENEYVSFFRDNFIQQAENISNSDNRFLNTLKVINIIYEKSNREFELYKSKFSLEEFQSTLEEEKTKYFKNLQDTLSEFFGKINSLPIQFGVYAYLIVKFEKDIIPLIAIIMIITIWSVFSCYTMHYIKLGLIHLHEKFEYIFTKISKKEIFDKNILELDKKAVKDRVKQIKDLMCWYQAVTIVVTVGFVILAICLMFNSSSSLEVQFINDFIICLKDKNINIL